MAAQTEPKVDLPTGIAHVQKILGHSQITTTAEYVKVAIGDLKKVVERKHPREKQYRRKK